MRLVSAAVLYAMGCPKGPSEGVSKAWRVVGYIASSVIVLAFLFVLGDLIRALYHSDITIFDALTAERS